MVFNNEFGYITYVCELPTLLYPRTQKEHVNKQEFCSHEDT